MLLVESFAGHEGEAFPIESGTPRAELVLMSVTPWGRPATDAGRQPFTLLLHGPLEPVVPQATYRFDHPALGPFDMFIVPVGPEGQAMRYEAVFT
jgi:hypothetical protein